MAVKRKSSQNVRVIETYVVSMTPAPEESRPSSAAKKKDPQERPKTKNVAAG